MVKDFIEEYFNVKTGQDLINLGVIPKDSSQHLALILSRRLEAVRDRILSTLTDEMLGKWIPLIQNKPLEDIVITDPNEIKKVAKVGMKIIGKSLQDNVDITGIRGIIKTIAPNSFGIEYDVKIPKGHNLDGNAKPEHGWLTDVENLNLIINRDEISSYESVKSLKLEDYVLSKGVVADKDMGHFIKFKEDYIGSAMYPDKRGQGKVEIPKNTIATLTSYDPAKKKIEIILEKEIPALGKQRNLVLDMPEVYEKLEVSSLGQMIPPEKEEAVKKQTYIEFFPKTVLDKETSESVLIGLLMNRDMILYGDPGTGKTLLANDIITIARHQRVLFKERDCQVQCNPFSIFDKGFTKASKLKPCPECMIKYDKDNKFKDTGRFVRPNPKDVEVIAAETSYGMGIEFVQGTSGLQRMHIAGYKIPKMDNGNGVKGKRESDFDPEGYHAGIAGRTNNGIWHFSEMSRVRPPTLENLLDVQEGKAIKPDQLRWEYPAHSLIIGTTNEEASFDTAINDRFVLIPLRYPDDVEVSFAIKRKAVYGEGEEKEIVDVGDTHRMPTISLLDESPIPVIVDKSIDAFYIKFRKEYREAGRNRVSGSVRSLKDATDASKAKLFLYKKFYKNTPNIVTEDFTVSGIQYALCSRIQEDSPDKDIEARKAVSAYVAREFPKVVEAEQSTWWCNVYKHVSITNTQIPETEDNFKTELSIYNKFLKDEGYGNKVVNAYGKVKNAIQNPSDRKSDKVLLEYPFMRFLFREQPRFSHFNEDQVKETIKYLMACREKSACKYEIPEV